MHSTAVSAYFNDICIKSVIIKHLRFKEKKFLEFRPRTRPAVAAIFAEDPNILSFGRFKRSLQKNLRRNQKRPSVFARSFCCAICTADQII